MAVDPIRGAGDPQTRVAGMQTAELFEEHSRMIYGLCRALLRDPNDADDATQSTFVSAYKSLLGGGVVQEPAAWLAAIARNECAARAHARMREPLPLIDADLGHVQGPEAELDRKTSVEELQSAIAELPENQRAAVVLRDLYGLKYTEVAAALGMSVASVESLLFRARRSLRVSLKPLASGALVVPVALRDAIAQALPGFTVSGGAGGGAASGAVGLGLLAKLTGGPVGLKIAAGVVAVAATGSVAVVGVEESARQRQTSADTSVGRLAAAESVSTGGAPLAGGRTFVPVSDRLPDRADDSRVIDGARSGNGRDSRTAAAAGVDRDQPERSASDGAREEGGSSGAQSGGDDGSTATEKDSGHDNAKPNSTRSGESGGSGEDNASEGHDKPLSVEASDSGSADEDTSGGDDGVDTQGSGESSDASNTGGASTSRDDSGSESEDSGTSGDEPPVTLQPPS